MSLARTIKLQATQTCLELARVGESQRLGDLDDEAAVNELDAVSVRLGVLESACSRHAAENLDAGAGRVADDLEDGEAYSDGDTEGEGVEYCGEEDDGHEAELAPAADAEEEGDVVGGFLDEGNGDDRDHSRECGFLKWLLV